MDDFLKFSQFSKVQEQPDGNVLVWGISTWEKPDLDNETCDFETAVPVYQAWSDAAKARTEGAGQELSLGPIRYQHSTEPAGKATKLEFKPDEKEIWLGSVPISDSIRKELQQGFLTGYSQGGSYAWRKCMDCGKNLTLQQANNYCPNCKRNVPVLFGLKRLSEVSYVDSPCTGKGFDYVKADGTTQFVKFAQRSKPMAGAMQLTDEDVARIAAEVNKAKAKTKTVDGVKLPSHCFAYVGDEEKTATWKLPIEFPGDDEKTKTHIRNALARFSQTKGIPDDKKAEVKAKIVAAAKKHGIDVDDEGNTKAVREFIAAATAKATAGGLEKGLWAVSRLADVLQTLAWLYDDAVIEREMEGDDSEVPDDLKGILEHLIDIFIASATEEAKELAANKADIAKGRSTMTPEEQKQLDELQKAAKKSLAAHFAKSAVHHEKLAKAHHEQAEAHEEMCEACKADVGDGSEKLAKALGSIHKAQASFHEKCAKAHEAHAEHLNKMAESHDKEEAEKTVKAERGSDPAPAQKNDSGADDFMTRVNKQADDELLRDPEFMKKVKATREAAILSGIAEKTVSEEVQKLRDATLAPDGVKVSDANGLRVVKRDTDKDFKLAPTSAPASDAGI